MRYTVYIFYRFYYYCFIFYSDWSTVQKLIKEHPDFNHYFYKCPDDIPWTECELETEKEDENDCKKIPCDVLETGEAESVFKNHASHLQIEQNRQKYIFKLTNITGNCLILIILMHAFF